MIWTAFTLGLLGSFHCAGMCGPLVVAVRGVGTGRAGQALLYHSGRALTYVMLGIAAGALGQSIQWAGMTRWFSIGLGTVILLGLVLSRVRRFWNYGTVGFSGFQKVFRFFASRQNAAGILGLGLLNGVLPCGLVVAALATAVVTGDALTGGLTMAVFALGTWPMMLAIHMAKIPMPASVRQKFVSLFPAVLMLTAILLILRGMNLGIPLISPALGSAACH